MHQFGEYRGYELPTLIGRFEKLEPDILPELVSEARHVLEIYGKQLEFTESGNIYKDIYQLNKAISEQMKGFEIEIANVELKDQKPRKEFVAYRLIDSDDFDVWELYLLPINILESVRNEELRQILLDFFAFLLYYSPFALPTESFEMCLALGVNIETEKYEPEDVASMSEKYRMMTDRYVIGDLHDIFMWMRKKVKDYEGNRQLLAEDVRKGIANYSGPKYYRIPNGEKRTVKSLFDLIEQGLELNMEDNITNYELVVVRYELGDTDFCEDLGDSDNMPFLGSHFLFTYDDDDIIENVIKNYNDNDGSRDAAILIDARRLAILDEPIKPRDYPKRYYQWFNNFHKSIYEQHD